MSIKVQIKEILNRMGFPDAEITEQAIQGRIKIDIKVKDARDLIGERGSTLSMFQHIIRRLAAKQGGLNKSDSNIRYDMDSVPSIDIDVNKYKRMREDILRDFALDIAERVRLENKAIEMDPMPPFDRRVIHLALGKMPDLATESMGEGVKRYVVVRPYP